MSEYMAKINWRRASNENFIDNQYSRGHEWCFDGGVIVPASSSAHVVPLPYSIADHVDPEEAFVASLSSCHMLFFLSIAAKRKYVVDCYVDHAVGIMAKDNEGNMAMTKVTLRPKVKFFSDKQPSLAQLEKMHHLSHQQCFIANSVKSQIVIDILES